MRDTARGQLSDVCRMLGAALIAALAVHALAPATGRAEAELTVRWSTPDRPPACPDRAWALSHITEQLGRSLDADLPRGVEADALIAREGERFTLLLETRDGESVGKRVLTGSDCYELADAAVLIVVLAVTEARERASSSPPASAVGDERAEEAPLAESPKSFPAYVRAEGLVHIGYLDRVAFGPALSVGVARGIWQGELTGFWLVPRSLSQGGDDGTTEASLWAGRLSGCALWAKARFRGGPCLSAELGRATGQGQAGRNTEPARNHTTWGAAGLGVRLGVLLVSQLALVVGTDLIVSVARPRFVTASLQDGATTAVHSPWPVQVRTSLGTELRF